MTTNHINHYPPLVYISCEHCYHRADPYDTELGAWYHCTRIDDYVTLDSIHDHIDQSVTPECSTLWCYDSQYTPSQQTEFSLDEAQWIGDLYTTLSASDDQSRWLAYLTWTKNSSHLSSVPTITQFDDAYFGHYSGFADFAQAYARDSGLLTGWSDEAMAYFSWVHWENNLWYRFTILPAPREAGDGVYIFDRNAITV